MVTKNRTVRVYHAHSNFLEGMARVIDIGGTLNQYDADALMKIHRAFRTRRLTEPSGIEAESEAIRKVWVGVGGCIREAMGRFDDEELEKLQPQRGFF